MINKGIIYILFLLLLFLLSCSQEINNNLGENNVSVEGTYIDYSYDDQLGFATIDAQINFYPDSSLELIDSVWIGINSEGYSSFHEILHDDGTHGDPIPGNGTYNTSIATSQIENGIYDINFNYNFNGDIYQIIDELTVGDYPPTINLICHQDTLTLLPEDIDSFYVYISIDDFNGISNIKSVQLESKKLDGYIVGSGQDGDCTYEQSADEEFGQAIDLFFLSETTLDETCFLYNFEQENNFIFYTGLQIDSFDDCGPHGQISFRYKITDYSNFITYSDEIIMNICWPGEACD